MILLTFYGQVRGGKNNMGVNSRTGAHFPRAGFRQWRDAMIIQVLSQLAEKPRLAVPLKATVAYYPGDLRRRDVPAILDAVWHVLERSGVVVDDALIGSVDFQKMPLDRENPRCVIRLESTQTEQ